MNKNDKFLQHLTKKLLKRFNVEYVNGYNLNNIKQKHFVNSLRRCYLYNDSFSLRNGKFGLENCNKSHYAITIGHISTDLFYFNNYLKNFYNG